MRKILIESILRGKLTEPAPLDREKEELVHLLDQVAFKQLGRSLAIREVDAGSCNGCELEIVALNNALYDLERFGLEDCCIAKACRCADGYGAGYAQHGGGVATYFRRHAGTEICYRGRRLRMHRRYVCR